MKQMKKIVSLLLILTTVLGALLLATACKDNTETPDDNDGTPAEKKNFAFIVMDNEGNTLEGVTLHFYAGTTEKGSATTAAGGVAMVELEAVAYNVVVDAPAGYTAEASYALPAGQTTLTITLTKTDTRPVYTVTVKDMLGDPIVGLRVQLCIEGGSCYLGPLTDENGVAVISVNDEATYYISFPEASQYAGTYIFEPKYYFEDGSKETTITIYPDNTPDGTAEKPFVFSGEPLTVTVPAGATHYFQGFGIYNCIFTATGFTGGTLVCGTLTATAEADGALECLLPARASSTAGNTPVVFTLTNNGTTDLTFTFDINALPGTRENPYVISDLSAPITVEVPADGAVYYIWTATANGTLTVSSASNQSNVTLNNLTTMRYGESSNGAGSVTTTVNANDELQIVVSTVADANGNPAATLSLTLTFTAA